MPVLAACHLIYVFSVVLHCISVHVVANKVLSLPHVHTHHIYIHATCKRHVEKGLTEEPVGSILHRIVMPMTR